ncbi:Ig-like domain-containing protein [Cryobacterium sp. N22]|uniref:Ig-like domain-containing protein n=1 Tax=Cryobacterium sp. N22 TaxID=2048290 RepID=UPI0011AFF40E|nr:Ig-like domain-containing protein [Cryobacterium sp. N22]
MALSVLAGVPLSFAVLHEGFPVTDVDLSARDVWVTNGKELLAGRLNRQIEELNASVNASSSTFDVVQDGEDVFLIDGSSGTIERIDPAFTTLGERVDVAQGSEIVYGGDSIAVMNQSTGEVWVINAAGELSFDPKATDPVMKLGKGGHIAVSQDGVVFGASKTEETLFTVDPAAEEPEAVTAELPKLGEFQLAAVGDKPVLLDTENHRLVVDGESIEVPKNALKLQQTGAENDVALVATSKALLRVPLNGGDIVSVDAKLDAAVTDPKSVSAPVWLNGCAHAAWSGAQRYLADCEGTEVLRETIEQPTNGSVLEFRVNRDVIALNNLSNGNVWLVDSNMRLVENWEEVTPPEESDAEDGTEKAAQQSFEDTLAERTNVNRAPLARDDAYGVRPGKTTVLPVLENDTDPDGDVLTVSNLSGFSESQGSLDYIDGGRAVQFTPAKDAAGTVSFRYTVADGRGAVAEAQVNVTMRPMEENLAPVSNRAGAISVEQGQLVSYNVLSDWIDPDGDDIYLVSASPTTGDGVRFGPEGFVTFESKTAELGVKEVQFVISDGLLTATGVLTVDVKAPGSLNPIGTPDFATVFLGETALIEPLKNDVTPSGAPLALIGVNEVPNDLSAVPNLERGTVAVSANKAGSYVFTYSLGAGATSSVGLIRVDVLENPDDVQPPIAVKDTAYLRAGEPVMIPVLDNDVSPSGRVLAVQSVDLTATQDLVTVEILTNTVLRVTAAAALTEQVQFTYTISDGDGTSTAGVTVVPVPPLVKHQPPVAVDDSVSVRAGDIVSVPVLDNDYHPDSATMTVAPDLADTTDVGGLAFVTGNQVRFQAPQEAGSYSVVYSISDAFAETATATVRFTVTAKDDKNNRPPTPLPLTMRTFAESTIKVQVPLDGIDPDGDSVYLKDVTSAPELGQIIESGSDFFVYEAYPGTAGTDVFSYQVEDTLGATAEGSVRIGVIPRPVELLAPSALDDAIEIKPGRTGSIPVVLNDSDPNGYKLTLSEKLPEVDPGITATVDGSRVIVETPAEEGTYTLRYEITNGHGGADTAFIQVKVTEDAKAQYPVAIDHLVEPEEVASGQAVDIDALEGAENPSGLIDELVISLEGPNAASGAIQSNGIVRVEPTFERQAIAYRLTNEVDKLSATAFIIVPAKPKAEPNTPKPSDPANAEPSTQPTPEEEVFPPPFLKDIGQQVIKMNGSKSWSLADIVEVPSGRPAVLLSATATNSDGSNPMGGSTSLSFTAAADYRGPAALTFVVTDGAGAGDPKGNQATLTIPITVGDPNFEDVAPTFTPSKVTVEAGEGAQVVNLRNSTGHPNPDIIQRVSYGSLGGTNGSVAATLAGADLTISSPLGTQPGAKVKLTFSVTYKEFTIPGSIEVTVVSSTRPVPQAVDDAGPNGAGIETRPSTSVTVPVLDNDYNPFAKDGKPLVVIGAVIEQQVGSASVAFTGNDVTVKTGSGATGTLTVVYTIKDATGDPARQTKARITFVIRNNPDAPNKPTAVEGDASATVSFTAPSSNNSPITGYTINWAGGGSLDVTSAGTHSITGLSNGSNYAFTVTARNALGVSSPSAASTTVTPYGKPGAPASATLKAPGTGTGELSLTWAAPGSNGGRAVSSYNYEWIKGSAANGSTNGARSASATGAIDQPSQYRVQACNPAGCGAWTSSDTATPQPTPPPPAPKKIIDLSKGNPGEIRQTYFYNIDLRDWPAGSYATMLYCNGGPLITAPNITVGADGTGSYRGNTGYCGYSNTYVTVDGKKSDVQDWSR